MFHTENGKGSPNSRAWLQVGNGMCTSSGYYPIKESLRPWQVEGSLSLILQVVGEAAGIEISHVELLDIRYVIHLRR